MDAATGVTVDMTGAVADCGFPLVAISVTSVVAVADVAVTVLPVIEPVDQPAAKVPANVPSKAEVPALLLVTVDAVVLAAMLENAVATCVEVRL